jgi:hypothetical protein
MRLGAVVVVAALAACGGSDDGGGNELGSLDDLRGDAPPEELVGSWEAYRTSDPIFQYYDPVTGTWSGNGSYSAVIFDAKGAYDEVDVLQTGAGSGCPSALYLHFQGTIRLDGARITFQRVRGRSIGENCNGRSEREGGFTDPTYGWSLDDGVLALGNPQDMQDALLYARAE